MDNELDNDKPQEQAAPMRMKPRLPHERAALLRLWLLAGATLPDMGTIPTEDELRGWSDDRFYAERARIAEALRGNKPIHEPEIVTTAEIQLESLRRFHAGHEQYYRRSEAEFQIAADLIAKHWPCEVVPVYAHSFMLKLPNGRILHYSFRGELIPIKQ